MNNTNLFILALLNIISELLQLTFETGVFLRKYAIPALVAVYVAAEIAWDMLTSIQVELPEFQTSTSKGFALS